ARRTAVRGVIPGHHCSRGGEQSLRGCGREQLSFWLAAHVLVAVENPLRMYRHSCDAGCRHNLKKRPKIGQKTKVLYPQNVQISKRELIREVFNGNIVNKA